MLKVMIVDDNKTNLIMAKKALEDVYDVFPMHSGQMALDFLKEMVEAPDILLLDVDMPDLNGFYVISEVKNQKRLEDMPVIFLTAQDDPATEIEGYSLGAVDYIRKPYTTALLRKRIDVHAKMLEVSRQLRSANKALAEGVNSRTQDVVRIEYATIEMLTTLIYNRSRVIDGHLNRVAKYMSVFLDALIDTKRFEIIPEDKQMLVFAAKIHDVGKLSMKDKNLTYIGEGSLQEKELYQLHTVYGSDAIKKVADSVTTNKFFIYLYNMTRFHHERWDGKGYPDKLVSTNIPLEARILSIVNSYDIFRTSNDGEDPLTHEQAMNRIKFWTGTHFDPALTEIFLMIGHKLNGKII